MTYAQFILRKRLFVIIALFAITSCDTFKNDEDEDWQQAALVLSTTTESSLYDADSAETDDITFEFDILKGGGGYEVEVISTNGFTKGTATLSDRHVKVELIEEFTVVCVRDKNGNSKTLEINSSNMSLTMTVHTIQVWFGRTNTLKPDTGVGGYSIVKHVGDATDLKIAEDGGMTITPLKADSDDYYVIKDKRGTVFYVKPWGHKRQFH